MVVLTALPGVTTGCGFSMRRLIAAGAGGGPTGPIGRASGMVSCFTRLAGVVGQPGSAGGAWFAGGRPAGGLPAVAGGGGHTSTSVDCPARGAWPAGGSAGDCAAVGGWGTLGKSTAVASLTGSAL